jgi:microcystin degradation protein MlrC
MCAGIGARTTIELGNKVPIPKIGSKRKPIRVSGVVRALTDGRYVVTGPTYTGQEVSMGRCAVLDTGTALIVISEKRNEPWDLGVFESVGIDPRRARFILLKSRMYCRPVFEPIVDGVVECDSRGVTSSDSSLFVYENLERPFYPLDDMRSWRAP